MNRSLKTIALFALLIILPLFLMTGCEETKKPTPPDITAGSTLLVCNDAGGAGNLTLIDLSNGSMLTGAAGLGRFPNDIVRIENRFYVINSGSNDINIFELSDRNVVTQIDTVQLPGDRSPQYATLAETGDIFISNFNDNTVAVFDPRTKNIVNYIPVGNKPQDLIAVGTKVYVCNSNFILDSLKYGPGTVSVISTTNNRVLYNIVVGKNPQYMAIDGSQRIHVVCTGDLSLGGTTAGEIFKINTRADTVEQVISIGGTPGDIVVTSNGNAYVAAGGWEGDPSGIVYRYAASTGQRLNGPDDPIRVSLGARRLALGPSNSVFVACMLDDRVDKIVVNQVTDSWNVGDEPGPMIVISR